MSFTQLPVEERDFARLGRANSSDAPDMLAKTKSGWAASRDNLRVRLVIERLTGQVERGGFMSKPMQRGVELEPQALAVYEAMTGNLVLPVGYLCHDTIMAGATPDGIVGAFEGVVEVKCPLGKTHLEYLKSGKLPKNYEMQVLHQMYVSGAEWCDWMSYHPDFPPGLRTKLIRIERDEALMEAYEKDLETFLAEVDVEETLVREGKFGQAHTEE